MESLNGQLQKRLTVGMTTCNRARFLSQSIEYFLNQTYQHIEFLILDDASSDETENICRAYAKKDSRIRYIRNDHNQGYRTNVVKLVNEASGDYFLWAHDDDWWHPTFLQQLATALDENPTYGVTMSWFGEHHDKTYDPDAKEKFWMHDYTDKSHFFVCREMIRAKINPIFIVGLFRTPLMKRLMRRSFPPSKEDTWIWLAEAALATRFYSVPKMLTSKYRQQVPQPIRHAFVGEYLAQPLPFTKNAFVTLWWILSSLNIPLYRKSLIFQPWGELMWKCKRKMAREIILYSRRIFASRK